MTQTFKPKVTALGRALSKDSRGRVRFTKDGFRYEVSKTGVVSLYTRESSNTGYLPLSTELASRNMIAFQSPDTLRTLADAIELAKS